MGIANILANAKTFPVRHELLSVLQGSIYLDAICNAIQDYNRVLMYTDPYYVCDGNEFDMYNQICKNIGITDINITPVRYNTENISGSANGLLSYITRKSENRAIVIEKTSNIIDRCKKKMTKNIAVSIVENLCNNIGKNNNPDTKPVFDIEDNIKQSILFSSTGDEVKNFFKARNRDIERIAVIEINRILSNALPDLLIESVKANPTFGETLAEKINNHIESQKTIIQDAVQNRASFLSWRDIKKKASNNDNIRTHIHNIANILEYIYIQLQSGKQMPIKCAYMLYALDILFLPVRNFILKNDPQYLFTNMTIDIYKKLCKCKKNRNDFMLAFEYWIGRYKGVSFNVQAKFHYDLFETIEDDLLSDIDSIYEDVFRKVILYFADCNESVNLLEETTFWKNIMDNYFIKQLFSYRIGKDNLIALRLRRLINKYKKFMNEGNDGNIVYILELLKSYGCDVRVINRNDEPEAESIDFSAYEPLLQNAEQEKSAKEMAWINDDVVHLEFDFNNLHPNTENKDVVNEYDVQWPCLIRQAWHQYTKSECDDEACPDNNAKKSKESKLDDSIDWQEIYEYLDDMDDRLLSGEEIRQFIDKYCLKLPSKATCGDNYPICKKVEKLKCTSVFLRHLRKQWLKSLRNKYGSDCASREDYVTKCRIYLYDKYQGNDDKKCSS